MNLILLQLMAHVKMSYIEYSCEKHTSFNYLKKDKPKIIWELKMLADKRSVGIVRSRT
jgi:hypothetical protein